MATREKSGEDDVTVTRIGMAGGVGGGWVGGKFFSPPLQPHILTSRLVQHIKKKGKEKRCPQVILSFFLVQVS